MLLNSIELENILSFKHVKLELRPLNVLIGANASGKSNFIRALGLLRSLPRDMQAEISNGGGPAAWINRQTGGPAGVKLCDHRKIPVYSILFNEVGQSYEILEENSPAFNRTQTQVQLASKAFVGSPGSPQRSILSEIRHPGEPLIAELAKAFESIRLYREFQTGPRTTTRLGIMASADSEHLSEEGNNLALVLSELQLHGQRDQFNRWLSRFFEGFDEVLIRTRGGIAQVYIRESGVSDAFSAVSLSDGTLRLLCLLAVLLDPAPPGLVCIEEPEIGMHPDAIRMVAELLVEASSRMQLVVTTHSPALIDALTSEPESVIVCERDVDAFTEFRRLDASSLDEWLEEYSLGQLWQKGEIGGNRW